MPTNIEITMRVITDVGARRSRYQIEVSDPSTKELLAMRSRPFHDECSLEDALVHASSWLRSALYELDLADPF